MFYYPLLVGGAVLLNGGTAMARQGATPCEIVSSMSADFVSLYPEATPALVPADAAVNCLKSVPVDVDEEKALILEMQLYVDWQSTQAYLKNPPEDHKGEQVDLVGTLNKISDDLTNGKYTDQYTLMLDMHLAFVETNDFHLNFNPDILDVFTFRRGNIGGGLRDEFALASVSSDGKELPKLYRHYDIMNAKEGETLVPISKINNQSAEDFLSDWSDHFSYHEDHARYNQLFPNQATLSTGDVDNAFGRSIYYDGEYTIIEYENGKVTKLLNTARIDFDALDNVSDGESFFAEFCNLGPPSSVLSEKRGLRKRTLEVTKRGAVLRERRFQQEAASKVKRQETVPAAATATHYPVPEVLHSEAVIGGYHLNGSKYEDVAVLSVPSFSPSSGRAVEEYQDLVGKFLKDAVDAGRKKLVVDLRGNGGGRLFLGYDLFKQLFPSMDPYGAARYRANGAFDVAGKLISDALKDITYEIALEDFKKNGVNGGIANAYASMFNYRLPLDAENGNFTSWEDFFGPHEFNGDNFTSVHRYDLNNFFSDDLSMDITGYATRAQNLNTKQPFEAKNIVLLQDGGCGSTCAIFAEFAKFQGGVEQIVIGGKPEKGPMEGVSGSKGAQVYGWDDVYSEVYRAWEYLAENQAELNKTEFGHLVNAERPLYRSSWSTSGVRSRINLRDNIRMNDTTQTPLEFVYEAADCRLFYTAEMYRDVAVVWKKAVDAHWGDAKKECVEDSTGHKSSISGGVTIQATLGEAKGGVLGNEDEIAKAKAAQKGGAATMSSGFGGVAMAAAVAAFFML